MPELDTSEIDLLDPFELHDLEADRLAEYFTALEGDAWSEPSACEGWSVREVLAHLVAGEEYNRACLDGEVAAMIARGAQQGLTDIEGFNEYGVRQLDGIDTPDLVGTWASRSARTRAEMRERADGMMDSSIGQYPVRLQAFHLASEVAVHSDDVGMPLSDEATAQRLAWRAPFTRFAFREVKPEAAITVASGTTRVTLGAFDVFLPDAEFVAAVDGRLPAEHDLAPDVRTMLSITP